MAGELEQLFEKMSQKGAKGVLIKQVLSGTATDVSDTTCTVERDGSPPLYGVRLNAIDDDLESYVTVYPKEGSNVLVAIIENVKTESVVMKCSEVENVKIKIGDQTLVMNKDGIVINDGTLGMVKVDKMVAWMNKVKVDLTAIAASLNSLGYPVTITTPSGITSDFENTKIKQ